VSQIESNRQSPTKGQLAALKKYTSQTQEEQEKIRLQSGQSFFLVSMFVTIAKTKTHLLESQSKSIATIILEKNETSSISGPSHTLALEYLNLVLSIRDREQLIGVLCKRNPDLLTPIARDLVSAYDPIIRGIHNAVDLSSTVSDAQAFLDDLIKLSRLPAASKDTVSVEDYVKLLEKHQSSSHRFLHQVVKNGPEIRKWYKEFAHKVLDQFRALSNPKLTSSFTLSDKLNAMFESLSSSDQTVVLQEIHAHGSYLGYLSDSSSARIDALLKQSDKTTYGPGVYLARWQALLDETSLTPLEVGGTVRYGGNQEAREASRTNVDGKKEGDPHLADVVESEVSKAPEVNRTEALLGIPFLELLRNWKREEA
jgi:hypothetical protein